MSMWMLCRKKVTNAHDWIMKEQMVKERVGKPIRGMLTLPRLKMFAPCNGKPSNFAEEDKGMTQREERR